MSYLPSIHLFERTPQAETILFAFFTVIEYLLLAYYLYISLNNKIFKRVLISSSIIFLASAFITLYSNLFLNKGQPTFDSIPVAISALILIIFCILYLFEKIQNPEIDFIYSKPSFWIVVGIMIYFSGTFFLFLQYANLSDQEQENFWIINLICIILKNTLFSISFTLSNNNFSEFKVEEPFINNIFKEHF